MADDARVILWGSTIGAVTWVGERRVGVFQYTPEFLGSGMEVAPLMMPLREFPYEFPEHARNSFVGLPGLLADSLPDAFGNAVINEWLALEGRDRDSFHPVERLCYTGTRGMGALEFQPAILGPSSEESVVEVAKLVELARRILDERGNLGGVFRGEDDRKALEDILRVGTSAGGARAKAILAWNPATGEFRSGQVPVDPGFEHWIMKFDGVSDGSDRLLSTPRGYGKIEYAYSLMAHVSGIRMTRCHLHDEGGRSHFMTKRFDRIEAGHKLHVQSLSAIAHYDYSQPSRYSYEQALQVMRRLSLPREDLEQQVLRAIFNVVGCNQDDHVKNIAFLMDRSGEWRLSPAFDISYARNVGTGWTNQHQMSVNGKRDGFDRADLIALAHAADIKKPRANEMIDCVLQVFREWPSYAAEAGVPEDRIETIASHLRTKL